MILTELLVQLHTNVAICMQLRSELLSLPCILRQKYIIPSEQPKKYNAWSCQNLCDALTFLLDKIYTIWH